MERKSLEEILKKDTSSSEKEEGDTVVQFLRGKKGEKGEKGETGAQGARGLTGFEGADGKDGKDGARGQKGEKGDKGERGFTGEKGEPGKDGKDGKNAKELKEFVLTASDVVEKINKGKSKIAKSRIEGLEDIDNRTASTEKRFQNWISLGGARSTRISSNGVLIATGAETINFVNGTVAVPAGNNGTTINYTAPSGGGSGYQAPLTGGLTGTNTWTTAPNVIVVDGIPKQQTSTDGTVNWSVSGSGPYTTILSVTPNNDVFASA
jgi:hypothetical protein